MKLEEYIDRLVDFTLGDLNYNKDFYKDAFFNYLAVTTAGAHSQAGNILVHTMKEDSSGDYTPVNRDDHLSLANCVMTDCLSSSIYAFDDIHFPTTLHPCGPVASAILGLSRRQRISLNEALEALYVGMEMECQIARLAKDYESHLYPTGQFGGIGASAALARLLHFDKEKTLMALSLAASYASGTRATHGSMAGGFIPAMAARAGFVSAMLVKNGFTCTPDTLAAFIESISTPNVPDFIDLTLSEATSCKPYPLGFISFASIEALKNVAYKAGDDITIEVSKRVATLGGNKNPQNQYEGLVSLPYIVSVMLSEPDAIFKPLNEHFHVSEKQAEIIAHMHIQVNENMMDQEAKITIGDQSYESHRPLGSDLKPMTHEDVIHKVKMITDWSDEQIESYYHDDIADIEKLIK